MRTFHVFAALLCAAPSLAQTWYIPDNSLTTGGCNVIPFGQNPGGYAITLIAFLVFMEKWQNFGTGLAIICAYLISIPGDISVATIVEVQRESWLSGRIVTSPYVLPLGSIVRPGILLIMMWALMIDTLIDIHRAVKAGPPTFGLVPAEDAAAASATSIEQGESKA